MKNTSKILALVLVVMTILMSLTAITASAAVSVRISGSFNGWGTASNTTLVGNLYCYKVDLVKGSTYDFKVVVGGSWMGNSGSISDTTITSTYSDGWDFSTSDGSNCKLVATTGGTYIFQWNNSTKKLNVFPHNSHDLEAVTTTEATCTTDGLQTKTCKVAGCGHSEEAVIQATGHSYTDGVCTGCGEAEPTVHEHFYVSSQTKAPSCTEKGELTWTCSCGEGTYTTEVEMLDHTFKYGACSSCGVSNPDYRFYLHGYIENKDYSGNDYAFDENNTLTINAFSVMSYIYVVDTEGNTFKTSAYTTNASATFNTTGGEKMGVATGFDELTFTIVNNKNGTITLSYVGTSACDHVWVAATCQEARHCSACGEVDGKVVNHYYADGDCIWCDATITDWYTVYVDNAAGWDKVYLHAWGSNDGDYTVWPGHELTKNEDGYYVVQIPANYNGFLLNDGDGTKTGDLSAPTDTKVIFNNSTNAWSCKHVWSDATCTEPKTCECGETEGTALGHDMVTDIAKAPTCTETGLTEGSHCSRCDAATTAQEVVPVIDHSYADGVCSACGASDPDYVAPQPPAPANDYVINFSDWNEFPKGTYVDGDVQKYNEIFTFIHGNDSRVDGSAKTFSDEFEGTLRFGFGGKTKKVNGTPARALQITADGAYTLKLWWVAGGDGRTIVLTDAEGNTVDSVTDVTGSELYISEFDIPAAGVYYLTQPENNNYWYKVELVEASAPVDPPHVNALVVGETNKIVIGDSAVDNGAGYLVESVLFVADEKAHYEFAGEGLTILVYDLSMNNLCGFTGKADLEAGTYIICIAANTVGTKGEFNVAVTKSEIVVPEHVNKLVVGENNKIVVDGDTHNQNNNPIEWVTFIVEEKAHYAFTSETEGALVYIFDTSFNILCGGTGAAVLEPGTYLICVGNGAVGDIYVQVTKTEIPTECEHNWVYMNCTLCGAANPNFAHNLLSVGENKVVCNEYHLVDTTGHGNPYQFTLLTVAEDGLYIFTCDKLIGVTIFTTEINDPKADFAAGTGTSWTIYEAGKAQLKAGTYYIGFIYVDGVGEYTVNIEKHEHNHEAVVTAPTCTEAGYTTHTCACGDTYTDSEVAALGHDYAEGVCSRCEAKDPDYVAPQPPVDEKPDDGKVEEPVQLNIFQKIIKLIKDLIAKFLGFFKRFGI